MKILRAGRAVAAGLQLIARNFSDLEEFHMAVHESDIGTTQMPVGKGVGVDELIAVVACKAERGLFGNHHKARRIVKGGEALAIGESSSSSRKCARIDRVAVAAALCCGITRTHKNLRAFQVRIYRAFRDIEDRRNSGQPCRSVVNPSAQFAFPVRPNPRAWHSLIVVLRVLHDAKPNLLQLALATGATRVFTRSGKRGKQDRGENPDDGNYDQKFDQGEA